MIVVSAALKGGVGKTTTSVYLAALAAEEHSATLVDADPQASAAEWIEQANDDLLDWVEVAEAPTPRLLSKSLDKASASGVAIVDPPPTHDRLLAKALERASVAIIPTRVGGVEARQVEAAMDLVPDGVPVGVVICSARTFTVDYRLTLEDWREAGVPVWGTIPERVAIAAGPTGPLAADGVDAYRKVWRRILRATGAS